MRPLLQRSSSLLARQRQFTLREFRQQQLPRPVCLQCQFLVVRRQPYSIGPGSSSNGQPSKGEKKSVNEQKPVGAEESKRATTETNGNEAVPADSPPIDITKLPSTKESKRMDISKRFSAAMNDLQGALFFAGKRLNEVTGYAGIEQMKKAIDAQEAHVRKSRAEVRAAKEAYQQAINCRSASQREVNELLQRKHAWSPSDLERFTSLYRSDHANEQEEVAAQERLSRAERVADEAQSLLTKNILSRYHEEQIWSDKIRSASTWVTWALMGFNVFLFVIVQLGLEPWRRKRLVGGFEEKVREVMQEETLRSALLKLEHTHAHPALAVPEEVKGEEVIKAVEVVEQQDPIPSVDDELLRKATTFELEGIATTTATSSIEAQAMEEELVQEKPKVRWTKIPLREAIQQQAVVYKENVQDLFSEKVISLRRKDVTAIAVESAAVGAIVTGVVAFIWNSR